MSYIALYRKFRPSTFDEVSGQEHIVTTLKNQIRTGRLAHAYLFCGTRGTGKTTMARIFAKAVNCEHPVDGSPCCECDTCRALESAQGLGTIIEIDAASHNGVEDVRELIDEVTYSPTIGQYKVYIIDEAHMITQQAFNALLKTLEEPPAYCIFILATTELQKLPVTILSRCQRYDFRRITPAVIEDRLKFVVTEEGASTDDRVLGYIARMADGAMRDALSILDQCLTSCGDGKLTLDTALDILGASDTGIFDELYDLLTAGDVSAVLNLLTDIINEGRDLTRFVADFIWYLRNLMLLSASDNANKAIDMSESGLAELRKRADAADLDTIMRYIRVFSDLSYELKNVTLKRVAVEVAMIRLMRPQMEGSDSDLGDRVSILENRIDEDQAFIRQIRSGTVSFSAAAGREPQAEPAKAGPRVLPEAVPEDIQKLVAKWGSVLQQMSMPVRGYLKEAVLSIDNDNRLLIVLQDENWVKQLQKEEHASELADTFAKATGKDIPFEMRYHTPDTPVDNDYADLSRINFEIETDDNPDEGEF